MLAIHLSRHKIRSPYQTDKNTANLQNSEKRVEKNPTRRVSKDTKIDRARWKEAGGGEKKRRKPKGRRLLYCMYM